MKRVVVLFVALMVLQSQAVQKGQEESVGAKTQEAESPFQFPKLTDEVLKCDSKDVNECGKDLPRCTDGQVCCLDDCEVKRCITLRHIEARVIHPQNLTQLTANEHKCKPHDHEKQSEECGRGKQCEDELTCCLDSCNTPRCF